MAMGVREFASQSNPSPGDLFRQYYTMAIRVVYYYDYFLTLPDEVLCTLRPFDISVSPFRR